jgi:hypothetical protein
VPAGAAGSVAGDAAPPAASLAVGTGKAMP